MAETPGPTQYDHDPPMTKTLWSDFSDYTSTHGPNHIKRSGDQIGKIIWSVISLIFTVVLIWQLVVLFLKFFGYPVNVLIDVKYEKNIQFPAVTVCNLNPYRKSKMEELANTNPIIAQLYGAVEDDYGGATRRKRRRRKRSDDNSAADYLSEYGFADYGFWDGKNYDYDAYDADFAAENQLSEAVRQLSTKAKKKLGHSFSTMLQDCTFAGMPCTPENFTQFYHTQFGLCYTMNGVNRTYSLTAPRAGSENGLTLELYAELNEYIPDLTEEAGFRVLIHSNDDVPFPETSGFNIPVGMATNVGVKLLEIVRMGGRYSDCNANTTTASNMYSLLYPSGYSSTVCQLTCYQKRVGQKCGCLDGSYPTDNPENLPILRECNTLNMSGGANQSGITESAKSADTQCMTAEWDKYNTGNFTCSCPQAEYFYSWCFEFSMASPKSLAFEIRNDLMAIGQPGLVVWLESLENTTGYDLVSEFQANFAKVRIFFEDLNYQKIYQQPAYTWSSLLSELGGQLGLWIGMSIMSILEWFELCGFCILAWKNRKSSGKKISPRRHVVKEFPPV